MAPPIEEDEEVKKLRKQLSATRLHFSNEVARYNDGIGNGTTTSIKVKTTIARLQKYRDKYGELSQSLLQLYFELAPDEADSVLNAADEFDNEVLEQLTICEEKLEEFNGATVPPSPSNVSHHSEEPQRRLVKLPDLVIPKYDGDPMQFTEFWDSFKSAIHDDQCIACLLYTSPSPRDA